MAGGEAPPRSRVAVLGLGTMGRAMATLAARHGHVVRLGSRSPEKARALAKELAGSTIGDYRAAAATADLIIWCIDFAHLDAALAHVGTIADRVVLDCSNPEAPEGFGLSIGPETSGAEELARRSSARVVKGFNHMYAELLLRGEHIAGIAPTVLLCGDDQPAKDLVARFARSCQLDALDCGPLRVARFTEPLAMLMVELVRGRGHAPADIALAMLRRYGGGAPQASAR